MAPTTKKRKRPTNDVAVVSTEDEPLTNKPFNRNCICICINGINGKKTTTIKVPGNMDTSASRSKSKEQVTRQAPAVKSKAAVTWRTPRSNKGQLLSVSDPRTPITRSKKQQLLSVQEPSMLDVGHSRQDPPTMPFARKWSNNDELCILRGLLNHRELYGKQTNWVVLYDKITCDGSFDYQDARIPEFKDRLGGPIRLNLSSSIQQCFSLTTNQPTVVSVMTYQSCRTGSRFINSRGCTKKMAPMKDPKGYDHKIELFRIACNVLGDHASNAHAHGADVDANTNSDVDAATATPALNNARAHGLAVPLGTHAGVVASPDAPAAPAAALDVHAGMGASPDDPFALAALARASPAAPAHEMLLPFGTTTSSSCDNSRDEGELSQWLLVVLWWGSRAAFLVTFAAFMSPGWRKGDTKSSWS